MQPFESALLAAFPLDAWRSRRVCVAVSGGADSVALLRGLVRLPEITNNPDLRLNFFVATVDHRSRGAESDGDVAFVEALAAELGVDFFRRTLDPAELEAEARRQGSWESAARTLRYRALVDAAKAGSARYLATAHHRDDQLETLLFRLFRGAGFDGMRGVPAVRPLDEALVLIRPLLAVGRAEILAYLAQLNQPYRVDSSNASPRYARNRIRNELAPLLESIFPGRWESALLRLSELAAETETFFDAQTAPLDAEIAAAKRRDALFARTLDALGVPDAFPNAANNANRSISSNAANNANRSISSNAANNANRSISSNAADNANLPKPSNAANNANRSAPSNVANNANDASSPNVVILPLEPLRAAPEPLVRRYFRQIWRDRNWPLAAMGAAEWRRLAAAVRKTPLDRRAEPQFPGDVRLTFPDSSTLRLERRVKNADSVPVDASPPFD
ncbi:MAG: tRNA lysidine(34) synthetase TilS [Thermoguttaceae bacterium]|nr:tRNA lysidine(34) synthetase TilS [Thermoguttaceae bacterium]